MDPFNIYHRTDLSENLQVYPSFSSLSDDDDHLLLDMDSLVTRKSNALTTRTYETTRKKCDFGEENNEIDSTGWFHKPVKSWCQEETINWLMSAASVIGQPYSSIQHSLAVPGNELVTFTRNSFINHDPVYGKKLYDLLHSQQHISNFLPSFDTIHPHSEDEYARINSNNASDVESDNSIEVSTKRPPGRPRVLKPKKNSTSQGKLWEFIRDLLRNRETCPSLICWEDYSQAKFRFVKSDEVAKRWGSRKGNTKMTYEKLSRAMSLRSRLFPKYSQQTVGTTTVIALFKISISTTYPEIIEIEEYYYKSKIFLPVLGRRLVYQFGPNAKGWETDNPNFRY